MKKIRFYLVLFLLLSSVCAPPPCFSAQVLRILSLNADWFPGRSPEPSELAEKIHMCQVRNLLVDVNPDILLLQEVRHAEAIDELISILPDYKVHTMSEFGWQQELVIASRFEALAGWARRWEPHEEHFQPRGLACAVISLPGNQAFAIYTVHLKSNYQAEDDEEKAANAALREASAWQLVEHKRWLKKQRWEHPLSGIVAGGDINTTYPRPLVRGEQTFAILKEGGLTPLQLPGIDHFLTSGKAEQGTARVLPDYRVSDHQPILYKLDLGENNSWDRAEPKVINEGDSDSCIAININQAEEIDLQLLPGIGPVLARRIVEHRPYQSIDDLLRVPRIGPITLRRIRPMIYID